MDAVFGTEGMSNASLSMTLAWAIALIVDLALSLNTMRLSNGKSIRTRWGILMEYLKKESYLDLGMVAYIVLDRFETIQELDITIHLIILIGIFVKLSQKGEILRTYFAFKKYVVMIDSVLLLLTASHFSVQCCAT